MRSIKGVLSVFTMSVFLQCGLLSAGHSFAAEDVLVNPLPLAKRAKSKPDELPDEIAKRKLQAIYVQANVYLGSQQFAELEKMADDFLQQYQAGKISGNDYLNNMDQLVPAKAGKGMLPDVLAWTRTHPKSYAAWFVLGSLYVDIAWEERGQKYARETSDAQFKAMANYALQAKAALVKSLELSPRPLASYGELIRVATIIPRAEKPFDTPAKQLAKGGKSSECAWGDSFASNTNVVWNEQLSYLCSAWRIDPNATGSFQTFVVLNIPRWGGDYETLNALFAELKKDSRLSAKARGIMLATLLRWQATDTVDTQPHVGAELYVQAFEASPIDKNVEWLYWAAFAERKKAKNLDRALVLYQKIADFRAGEADAIAQMGWIYEERGDNKKYIEKMGAAALLGLKEAQNNIGYFYMVGQRGLPKNLLEARSWLTLAANQGFEHSREKLPLVEAMIAKEGLK